MARGSIMEDIYVFTLSVGVWRAVCFVGIIYWAGVTGSMYGLSNYPGITLQLAPKDGLHYGSSTRIQSRLIELMHLYLIKELYQCHRTFSPVLLLVAVLFESSILNSMSDACFRHKIIPFANQNSWWYFPIGLFFLVPKSPAKSIGRHD